MKEKWEKIATEHIVSLFPVFMLVDAFDLVIKKIIGRPVYLTFKIENDAVHYYYLPHYWQKAHIILAGKVKKDPLFLKNIFTQIDSLGKKTILFTEQFKNKLKDKINEELNEYYQNYIRLNTKVYGFGLILSLIDFQKTTFLSDEVDSILKNKKATKYFDILTTPLSKTLDRLQELNLLRILARIKKEKNLYRKFKEASLKNLVKYLATNNPEIWNLIKQHTEKYCWVHYVYEGPAADDAYFIDIIKDFIERKINPEKEINNREKEKDRLKKEQNNILKKIKPTKHEVQIIELARDAVFFKAYRRELQSWSYYNCEFLLREIGTRTGLTLRQVRMMLPEEIKDALIRNETKIEVINNRLSLVVYGRNEEKRFCLSGEKGNKFIAKNFGFEKKIGDKSKFTGTIAFRGKAIGTVRIINAPKDIIKMKNGDILISAATNPNLMPAIRKAVAIVTDEGGLTCHAAIVSRELKIPCVVGTKIGTKALKDGDKVEVDASKGIVRKIG